MEIDPKILYWEEIFDNFINALIVTFPENKQLPVYRDNLLGLRQKGLNLHIVKHVVSFIEPVFPQIKSCDSTLFQKTEPVYLLKGIDFREFFNGTSVATQVALWSHLQSVYIAGKRILDESSALEAAKGVSVPVVPVVPETSNQEGLGIIMDIVKDIDPSELFGSDPKDLNINSLVSSLMGNPNALKGIESKIRAKLSSGNVNTNALHAAAQGLMSQIQSGDFSAIEQALGEEPKKSRKKKNNRI